MRIICLIFSALCSLSGISVREASAQDGYDVDCAVILCMAGGWPVEPSGTCNAAKSYMIDRIRDLKPPIGVCSTSEGGEFTDYDLDYEIRDRQLASNYSCPAGTTLFFKTNGILLPPTAFCYTQVASITASDFSCQKVYSGLQQVIFADFWAKLTVSPGSPGAYISPETLLNINDDETTVNATAATSFVMPCEVDNGGGDPGTETSDVSTDVVPPPNPSCLQVVAQPSGQQICNAKWSILDAVGGNPADRNRVGCRSLSDGSTALVIEDKAGSANSLVQLIQPTPQVGDATAVRASVEMYIPADYQPWSGGRLPFGIQIGNSKCSSGGCTPSAQLGSTVRTNFFAKNGSLGLQNYSYHLNRKLVYKDPGQHWTARTSNRGVYGEGVNMTKALPKGEWVTLTFDLKLNDVGRANGSSTLAAYDNKGNLIGSATHANAIYRKNASWKITGFALPDKFNTIEKSAPKDQERLFRNYKMAIGDALSPQCK